MEEKQESIEKWRRCVQSYVRDFMVYNSDLKRETAERPGVAPMYLKAFNGCGAILKRRVKFNNKGYPIMRLYKIIDIESSAEMMEKNTIEQQSDDNIQSVVTYTDLTLDDAMNELFLGDDSKFEVYIVSAKALFEDGWTPLYDRGIVYWYPPLVQEYLYGAPEFTIGYLSSQCIDY